MDDVLKRLDDDHASFREAWRDISLPDLVVLWGAKFTKLEENRESMKSLKSELKEALSAFNRSAAAEASESKDLIAKFKSSFDKVSQCSKYAEQSFQTAYLILANASDPAILADSSAALLEAVKAGEDLPGNSDADKRLATLQAQVDISEQNLLERTEQAEREVARKDAELEAVLESLRRQQEADQSGGGDLQLALEVKKSRELERKLLSAREELAELDTRTSKHLKKLELERNHAQEQLQASSMKVEELAKNSQQLQIQLQSLHDSSTSMQQNHTVEWEELACTVGFHPAHEEVHDCHSFATFLGKHFRTLERECVATRLQAQDATAALQVEMDAHEANKMALDLNREKNNAAQAIESTSSSSEVVSSDKRILLELTRQRNALQEEVTRLNVQASLKVSHRDTGPPFGRNRYDLEAAQDGHNYNSMEAHHDMNLHSHGNGNGQDEDDKYGKAFDQMNTLEQALVNGSRIGMHDFWSRHALIAYLFLVHLFALCYVVHDLNPEIVSEVDFAMVDHHTDMISLGAR